MTEQVLLQATGITKYFPGTVALDAVDLTVRTGEVHVLLGENGAGKSTLVKIIAGIYTRDAGEISLNGQPVNFRRVRDAQAAGISMIHQELNLLPERTIAQNIFIGKEPRQKGGLGFIDERMMRDESRRLMHSLGLNLDPDMPVKKLSIAQQQMVEVVKALSNQIKLIIMDEPTSSLTKTEIDMLFGIIDRLKREHVSIIYISHRMDEIARIGDRVTIMRDGKYVDNIPVAGMDIRDVVAKMVGRKIENLYQRTYQNPGAEVLRTESLSGLRFRNVSIALREREIVSLAGLIGAGRTEIAKSIFGYDPIESGRLYLFGQQVRRTTPMASVRKGVAFLPENRKEEGLFLKMSIKNNMIAASMHKYFGAGIIRDKKERLNAERFRKELRIASPGIEKLVGELSGGNQQKVVIAKWLAPDCRIYIFDEPTRGIDVGAKAEIYQLLDRLAAEGAAILMISSEMNEVIGLSDRVYVIREGEVAAEFPHQDLTQEMIIANAISAGAAANEE